MSGYDSGVQAAALPERLSLSRRSVAAQEAGVAKGQAALGLAQQRFGLEQTKATQQAKEKDLQIQKLQESLSRGLPPGVPIPRPNARMGDIQPGLKAMILAGTLTKKQAQQAMDYFRAQGHEE